MSGEEKEVTQLVEPEARRYVDVCQNQSCKSNGVAITVAFTCCYSSAVNTASRKRSTNHRTSGMAHANRVVPVSLTLTLTSSSQAGPLLGDILRV